MIAFMPSSQPSPIGRGRRFIAACSATASLNCPRPKARCQVQGLPIGYFHIDIAEVRTEQGKLYLFVAIDRTSKFAFVELHEKATRGIAADFLRHLIAAAHRQWHALHPPGQREFGRSRH